MDQEFNQHFLRNVHLTSLARESFKEIGPVAYNSEDSGNLSMVDNMLSLSERLNMANDYSKLRSRKDITSEELNEEITEKYNKMLRERESLNTDCVYDDQYLSVKSFSEKFVSFLMDNVLDYSIALKLDDNNYKYIQKQKQDSHALTTTFHFAFRIYKLMFPNIKIDIDKSQFVPKTVKYYREINHRLAERDSITYMVINSSKDEDASNDDSEQRKNLLSLVENVNFMTYFESTTVDFDKVFVEKLVNNDMLLKVNQYLIVTLEELNNIPKLIELQKEASNLLSKVNEIIKDANKLASLNLLTIPIDDLFNPKKQQDDFMRSTTITNKTYNVVPDFDEYDIYSDLKLQGKGLMDIPDLGDVSEKLSKVEKFAPNRFKSSDLLPSSTSILGRRRPMLGSTTGLELSMVPGSEESSELLKDDYSAVLYNKHFNRLVLCEYLNYWNINLLSEFTEVKKLSKLEFAQLSKYYKDEIENYDESDSIADMTTFITNCLSKITSKEQEDIVLVFMKGYFTFTASLDDKMKFSEILRIVNDNLHDKISTIQLSDYLKKLNLQKKRYNDGIYWYGIKLTKNTLNNEKTKNPIKSMDPRDNSEVEEMVFSNL